MIDNFFFSSEAAKQTPKKVVQKTVTVHHQAPHDQNAVSNVGGCDMYNALLTMQTAMSENLKELSKKINYLINEQTQRLFEKSLVNISPASNEAELQKLITDTKVI